ncbi:Origin recognition complex subunit 2 [Coemansia biformis]|uniref:Origin recognition complex subunit 2 n=1 Tax=Coemansia biformis TaxID=1286918 RepID=A0A9W8CY28_9FUNG|nr:Origin recognition complex subunit 2 [Coemansia biformis]
MADNGSPSTPRTIPRARNRFDMGLTLTATRRGRRTLLTDNTHETPSRTTSEVTDILKLGAAAEADDKENSSEETSGICSVAGQTVYGFQKRAARKRASSSSRGGGQSARGRRGSGTPRAGRRATIGGARRNASGASDDDDEEDEDNDDDDNEQRPKRAATNRRPYGGSDGSDSDSDGGDRDNDSALEGDADDFADTRPAYERYFQDLNGSKGPKTSDNTLAKLPRLTPAQTGAILASVPTKHKEELALLDSLHRRQFRQWFFEMTCGFSIMFYGFGSKRQLINSFATQLAESAPVAIVNGYFPALNLKQSLEKIASEILGLGDTTGSAADLALLIRDYFGTAGRAVDTMYVIVHNIDGQCLRKHQAALAALASSPRIHLVASIDHIEAPLIWDASTATRFNWAWHDLTTFEPYAVETSNENFGAETKNIGPRGVLHVLASLTENAKGIFRVLAEFQVAESVMDDTPAAQKKAGAAIPEMPFGGYFAACRDQFLVSSEMTFRSQLTEFRDHQVIQSRHAADGTEFVFIPLDAATLGSILEGMD